MASARAQGRVLVEKRKIHVATGRKLRAKKRSLTKITRKGHKKGKKHILKADVEYEGMVISPRGRTILPGGVVSPFEQPPEEMPQGMQDYFLTSRAIRSMAYDPNRMILEIIFQTGYGYHFYSVPQNVWINLKMAQSKGKFFMKNIYGYWAGPKGDMTYFPNYTYRRIM